MALNRIITSIVEKLLTKLKRNNSIEGIVVYGSYARSELDYYSDVDMIVYVSDSVTTYENVLNDILEVIRDIDNVLFIFEKHGKFIIYTTSHFIKLEITIKKMSEIEKADVILVKESRVRNLKDAILFDRNNRIRQAYERLWNELDNDVAKKARYHIFSVLYYYDNFLVHFSRGDIYRAYMNYTIAFYHLASVLAIANSEFRNTYQPWFLTRDILKGDSLKRFYEASSSMNPVEMFYSKETMLSLFLDAVERIEKWFNLGLVENIKLFIKKTREKYPPFYNFRDISKIVNLCSKNVKIRPGLIFRSASLSRYRSETLLKFLRENNIRYIVDLRTEEDRIMFEKAKGRKYSDEIIQNYLVNIPINAKVKIYIENDPYKNLYYGVLKESKDAIRRVFEDYIANADKAPLIIHCEGGKDRTGIIIAILLRVLGVERECIIEDYLASYSDTKREYIEFLLDVVDKEYGGVERYLVDYCGVSRSTIEKIRKILVLKK